MNSKNPRLRTEIDSIAREVFRIAGGDIECCPAPNIEQAFECLRDLRACYEEALASISSAKSGNG